MVIQLYSEIGTGDCTAKVVADKLKAAGNENVQLRINSPGGLISDGIAIYNLIREHGDVEVTIDGVCASIATVIMCGAKSVTMAKNAMLFIHQPLIVGNVEANADSLRKIADGLDMNEDAIVQTYVQKVKGKVSEGILRMMMEKDTYLSAEQALALGLVDYVIEDVLSDSAVNIHKGLLLNKSIMAEDKQESPAPAAAPTPEVPEWQNAMNELKTELTSLKAAYESLKAASATAQALVVEEKAQVKPHMKAIKPEADSESKPMSAMDRAKQFRAKIKK